MNNYIISIHERMPMIYSSKHYELIFVLIQCQFSFLHAVYEAMESFAPENEDEVGFAAGERLHVISKSMDGWWKIRYE